MSAELLTSPSPNLQSLAVRAAVRADAMGLLPERIELAATHPDTTITLSRVLDVARDAGIGRGLVMPGDASDEARWEGFVRNLLDAMEESPVPRMEWRGLERALGVDLLSHLVGVSPSSLRRYAIEKTRDTPDDVAARLHFLALVVGDLSGSYNEIGVRRWFGRRRTQLGGKAPAELLQGAWDPQDEGPGKVRALAAALLGTPAT